MMTTCFSSDVVLERSQASIGVLWSSPKPRKPYARIGLIIAMYNLIFFFFFDNILHLNILKRYLFKQQRHRNTPLGICFIKIQKFPSFHLFPFKLHKYTYTYMRAKRFTTFTVFLKFVIHQNFVSILSW